MRKIIFTLLCSCLLNAHLTYAIDWNDLGNLTKVVGGGVTLLMALGGIAGLLFKQNDAHRHWTLLGLTALFGGATWSGVYYCIKKDQEHTT